MIGDALSMVVTSRSSRFRAFRAAVPAFARSPRVHAFVHSCSNALLGFSALVGIGVVTAVLLSGSRPSWWPAGAPAQSEASRKLAGAVDNGAWTVVTQVRPMKAADQPGSAGGSLSEPWSVSLSSEAATAWLNESLPRWLAAQERASPLRLPAGAEMCVAFEPGTVRLGARLVTQSGSERFVALALTPRVDERGGGLWLPASAASLGRLEVPVAAVIPLKGGAVEGLSPELLAVLRGEAPALTGTSLRLPDGRTVRLLKLEAEEGRVVLTLRTEAGGPGKPEMAK